MSLMNQHKVAEIIFKLLSEDEEITAERLLKLKKEQEKFEVDEDEIIKSNELFCLLFNKYRYYKVLDVLYTLERNIRDSSKECAPLYYLVRGYIGEKKHIIKGRMHEEVYYHLLYGAKEYYQNGYMDLQKFSIVLGKNLLVPEEIFKKDMITSSNYKQIRLFNEEENSEDIKDNVSKKRFNQKQKLENQAISIFTNFYDKNSFKDFQNNLLDCINKNFDTETKYLLLILYSEVLDNIYKKILTNWKNKKEEDLPILLELKKLDRQ